MNWPPTKKARRCSMGSEKGPPLLELRSLSKQFPGVLALDNVSLNVNEGEIHGLVGKNGAGKSTLVNIIMGLIEPTNGEIVIKGIKLEHVTPQRAITSGIAFLPQESKLVPALTVAENLFCGKPPIGRFGFVDWRRMTSDAEDLLQRIGLDIGVRRVAESLSVGEQQMVGIAKALFGGARLVILDEPTAALNRREVEVLFHFMRSLRDRGVSFIYISHFLTEVFDVCDRVTVLRNGRRVTTSLTSQLTENELARLMVGRDVVLGARSPVPVGQVELEVDGLSDGETFRGVSFQVRSGEILGITGLMGSGKTELAEAIFGLRPISAGHIKLSGGRTKQVMSPREALHLGVAYLPEDRRRFGILPNLSVAENITVSVLSRLLGDFGLVRPSAQRELAHQYVERLEIATPSVQKEIAQLSGGNQQKSIVAKLLATRPHVLILGEPTRGIDIGAKAEIFRIIDDLTAEGLAVLIISDEIHELLAICDRVLVMFQGEIVREFARGESGPDVVLVASEGVLNHGRSR